MSDMGSADVDALIEEIMRNGEVTLRSRKLKYFIILFIILPFLIFGIVLILDGELLGWALVIFFGVLAFFDGIVLCSSYPYAVLTPEGYTVCGLLRSGSAKWTDFKDARARWDYIGRVVMVKYSESCKSSTLGKAVRAISFDLAIIPETFGLKAEDFAELMNKMRERALGSVPFDAT